MGIIDIEIIYDIFGLGTNRDPRMLKNIPSQHKDAIYRHVADLIFAVSQDLVPVNTGRLKASGKVVRNSIGTYSIIYTAPYAPFVHEIIDYHHEKPTQAKFLEDAAWEVLSSFGSYLAFTFTMDTGYDNILALHIDSLTLEDFKENIIKIYNNHQILSSGDLSRIDDYDTDFIEVKEAIHYDIN